MIHLEGEYVCGWCGVEFKKVFSKVEHGCSAVKCPNCGCAVKPVRDAKKLVEIKNKRGMV